MDTIVSTIISIVFIYQLNLFINQKVEIPTLIRINGTIMNSEKITFSFIEASLQKI